ncbi:MAG: hypothetical protein QOF60_1353 [Actinomycetota bacterium]|jgi:hypothetical protein|nr:hypothetical protein [Actinomycetota bacterium]
MEHEQISVADLLLDVENPRHPPANNQREAIALLLEESGRQTLKLAEDIAVNGLSPIDEVLVLQNRTGTYTVLEGNRRIAAIKLLSNPTLAVGGPWETAFKRLAAKANLPAMVRCAVATSREEAQHWLQLRHTGQNEGAGVVPWNSESTQRFKRHRGSHADRAISFLDAVNKAYPKSASIKAAAREVAKEKLTTLGRLVADPDVRAALGTTFADGEMLAHYSAPELLPAVQRILEDLAGSVTVTDLKTKAQRKRYVGKIRDDLPDATNYLPTARPLSSKTVATRPRRAVAAARGAKPPDQLFTGVNLNNLGSRIQSILTELKGLDLERFPNAACVLLRAVIELSVDQVFETKHWMKPGKFKDRVKKCLAAIDSSGKDAAYQAVRTGLQDGTSLMAVATLHAWVHNPHFHPTATELRQIAFNFAPFLTALDGLV